MRHAAALLLLGLCAVPAAAQQPRAAVVPESITVGDVFHAAVRIDLPEGVSLAAPDSLVVGEDLENAGPREVRIDTAGGTRTATVLYPLAAWRPGSYELPDVTLRLTNDGSDTTFDVALPSFDVRSVLPADTAGVEPKPAKDVLGANRIWWPLLLALLILALIITGLYMWWRRRRGKEAPLVFTPAIPPLEVALARFAALRREGLIERGEFRAFYDQLTETLRHYAAAVEPHWSVDLTTSELAARLRADAGVTDALELTRILGAADMVKFARAVTTRENAAGDLDAAQAWVQRFAARSQPDDTNERRAA